MHFSYEWFQFFHFSNPSIYHHVMSHRASVVPVNSDINHVLHIKWIEHLRTKIMSEMLTMSRYRTIYKIIYIMTKDFLDSYQDPNDVAVTQGGNQFFGNHFFPISFNMWNIGLGWFWSTTPMFEIACSRFSNWYWITFWDEHE